MANDQGNNKKQKRKAVGKRNSVDIEAIGLVILALGIFLFGLLIPAVPTGQMGQEFRNNVGGAMGWAMVMLPWPLIIAGALFITRNNPTFLTRVLTGYSLVCLGAWLFSSLIDPELSGRWGYSFRQVVFGAIGWLSYLLAIFIISLGIDLFLNWRPTHFASTVLRFLAIYVERIFKSFLKLRGHAKERANFHADVVLVKNDLRSLEKDLLSLSMIHSSPQESSRLAEWRNAIEVLRKDLNRPTEDLLQEAYRVLMEWCESLQEMSNESTELLIGAMENEQIDDFDIFVSNTKNLLEFSFQGKTLTTTSLESLRQKIVQSLGQLQGQYQALLTTRDSAKAALGNKLSSQEKGAYPLRSINNQDLQGTSIFWNEGGVSPKVLVKAFENHKMRLNKLDGLAAVLEKISESARGISLWTGFSSDLENFSEEVAQLATKNAVEGSIQEGVNLTFQESFAEFDSNLRNEVRDESEGMLRAERLAHWQESLAELKVSLEEVENSEALENLPAESEVQAEAVDNDFDWRKAPQQVKFEDLDPEETLGQVPATLLEATLKPSIKAASTKTEQVIESKPDNKVIQFKSPEEFELPELGFLQRNEKLESMPSSLTLRSQIIDNTIESFRLKGKVQLETSKRGPTVTRFEIRPGEGEKISRYANLSDDIALAMGVASVRIEAPIQGKKDIIGLEVPNEKRDVVRFRESVEAKEFQNIKSHPSILPVVLGKTIEDDFLVANLSKMPHLLIAGSTGSGKSVAVNVLVNSLLYCFLATELRFLMIDPKMVELTPYDGIPHLLRPVVTNPNDAAGVLLGAVAHMERRYKMMSKIGAKSLEQYNHKAKELDMPQMPFIVIIIDELADLMITSPKEVESAIMRLAQMARATGMHLILATQRPSVDILTSLIKVNVPARMAFAVSSSHDSRTILDTSGAERLTGMGDMLFYQPGLVKPVRLQGPFINEVEIASVSNFLREQTPFFDDEFVEAYGSDFDTVSEDESEASGLIDWKDSKLREAAELVINEGQASVSRLQRRLQVGHARAGKLMDSLEALAIVGAHQGSKPREVLMGLEDLPNVFGS